MDCAKILTQDRDISEPWGWHKYEKIMRNGGEAQLRKWTQAYLASVSFVDAQVGKILDAIESREDADNTIVIFTSDHGYHMGEKEYVFKFSPWEESVRIPLVVSGPGIAKGLECFSPVSLIDIYPTCMDYGSAKTSYNLDGFSLRSLLEDPVTEAWAGPSVSVAVSGSKVPVEVNQPARAVDQHFSLRSKYFRYIRCRNGEEEFYDHRVDPNEWTNQIDNPDYRGDILGLQRRLSAILNKTK